MTQYIDKTKVIKEIDNIISDETESIKSFEHSKNVSEIHRSNARLSILEHIRTFLDTLEIKEVDLGLEKKFDKYCTDLKQSKKLKEILSPESADLGYLWNGTSFCEYPVSKQTIFKKVEYIPCWSLAALLEKILPKEITINNSSYVKSCDFSIEEDCWYINYYDGDATFNTLAVTTGESLLDATFEMILKLHEEKLL